MSRVKVITIIIIAILVIGSCSECLEAILGFLWFDLMKEYPVLTTATILTADRVIKPTFEVLGYPTGYV